MQNPAFRHLKMPMCFGSSGGGAPTSSTVTQVQQIPDWQQAAIQNDESIGQSLAANPYPLYQSQLVAPINATQSAGMQAATDGAFAYAPYQAGATQSLNNASNLQTQATYDPTANATYGANAVANANPVAGTSNAVNALNASTAAMNPVPGVSNNVNALDTSASGLGSNVTGAAGAAGSTDAATLGLNPANAGVIQKFMSPYVQNALAPQLQQAAITQAGQQSAINAQATGAHAFGDARQGMENAYQNYLGQQTNAGIEASGYNTAYSNALNTALGEQSAMTNVANNQLGIGTLNVNEQNALAGLAQNQLGLGALGVNEQGINNTMANNQIALGQLGTAEQGVMQNQQTLGQNQDKTTQSEQAMLNQLAQQYSSTGLQAQNQLLAGANAQYNVGNIEQQNQQAQDNVAYQQYENQVNWPYQMLNVMESTVNSSPYQLASATTLPQPNTTQAGLGAFTSLAGALGSLSGSGSTTKAA